MEKFGYAISKGRQIDYESNDRRIAEYIFKNEPSFRLCIECGGCSATCTTGNFTEFSLRELQILIKRGENDKPRQNIKKCMLCGKCILVCPRGVNTRNVIVLARQAFQKLNEDAI
ncbi:MAG: 4Fe-4S dicluster domain-containing protein [Anaerolineales bacterium]|nr:4Fe-4S dicluster domain-containing protein [Anaerolineales bacterium]